MEARVGASAIDVDRSRSRDTVAVEDGYGQVNLFLLEKWKFKAGKSE
jgi:hypothetical protein